MTEQEQKAFDQMREALQGMLQLDQENHQCGYDDQDVCAEVQAAQAALTAANAVSEQQYKALSGGIGYVGRMPPEQEEMNKAAHGLAMWLAAALDDPKVCAEYKEAINAWFNAAMPFHPQATEPAGWKELTSAAREVLGNIEAAHSPPVRDFLEFGRMVSVRLHALASLHDALNLLAAAPEAP